MKKLLFTVMAVAAIGFTSCGNKTQQTEAADGTEVVVNADDAESIIANLKEYVETKDAAKLQEALAAVKEKIAELIKQNPEAAKEYVAKVQAYLKENAESIKALVGENEAANAAVSALTSVEPEAVVNGLLEQVGNKAEETKDAAVEAAEAAKDAAVDAAKEKAEETKAAAKEKANEAIDNAAKDIKKGLRL